MRNQWIWLVIAIVVMVGGALAWRQWNGRPTHEVAEAGAAENLPMDVRADDKILGRTDAPVTIIEYASLSCPHCAKFHTQTLPELKTQYIDTGKVRLVYRDYPLEKYALAAAAVAHCAPGDRYFAMIDLFFQNQDEWAHDADPRAAITRLAAVAGMDKAAVDACLADQAGVDKILAGEQEAQTKYSINSTPSFIINGRKLVGARSIEEFSQMIKEVGPKS